MLLIFFAGLRDRSRNRETGPVSGADYTRKQVQSKQKFSIIAHRLETLIMVVYWILAYLFGSLPFGLWITHLFKNVDVRDGGSGHVGTTNTLRQAGWFAGVMVLILDLAKGYIPVYFALRAGLPVWSLAITAGFVVIGHCWPLFANFRGGMGLAATGGTLLAVNIPAFFLALGLLVFLLLTIRHAARASLFTGLFASFFFWLMHLRGVELWVMAATGLVVALRFSINWNREYRELWLDREKAEG